MWEGVISSKDAGWIKVTSKDTTGCQGCSWTTKCSSWHFSYLWQILNVFRIFSHANFFTQTSKDGLKPHHPPQPDNMGLTRWPLNIYKWPGNVNIMGAPGLSWMWKCTEVLIKGISL